MKIRVLAVLRTRLRTGGEIVQRTLRPLDPVSVLPCRPLQTAIDRSAHVDELPCRGRLAPFGEPEDQQVRVAEHDLTAARQGPVRVFGSGGRKVTHFGPGAADRVLGLGPGYAEVL